MANPTAFKNGLQQETWLRSETGKANAPQKLLGWKWIRKKALTFQSWES
jgi:hypothetical protein